MALSSQGTAADGRDSRKQLCWFVRLVAGQQPLSLPVRQPNAAQESGAYGGREQSRWLRTADGFAVSRQGTQVQFGRSPPLRHTIWQVLFRRRRRFAVPSASAVKHPAISDFSHRRDQNGRERHVQADEQHLCLLQAHQLQRPCAPRPRLVRGHPTRGTRYRRLSF